MRASGFINFVLVTSATACLMGVVTKPSNEIPYSDEFSRSPADNVLPTDTPETEDPELIYEFKDNAGKPPMTDPKSKLYLDNPENVKTDVQYNPKTGKYDIKQKVGDMDYRPETYMNLKEYQDYVFKKSMRDYWRSRVAADEANEKPRKGMIPPLKVSSELFDRIFGGNTVDIKPTGTAELIFGLQRSKNFNPAIPQKQQKITNFDFNMRIQLNLIGKIGDKLKITTNYNTEASFDWENQVKLDYTGYEDEIIKKIEAGNVTLPLNSSLISGSQTLFGFKTELQFGRLRATTVFSQQRGKKQEVTVQGGAQTQLFNINGDTYENNKHYFLGHYFRDNFDRWMSTLPVINTPVVITKVEVYVSNVNGTNEQTRKIAAFEDLGEDSAHVHPYFARIRRNIPTTITPTTAAIFDSAGVQPHNGANSLYSILTNTNNGFIKDRNIDNVTPMLASIAKASNPNNDGGAYMVEGRDFNRVSNARRLNPSEYYFNPRTGFISLNQQLNNDQVLAVSFQYTYGNKIYQVGEFSDQIPDNNMLLVCKLLKPTTVSVKHPMWDLMMKNVYSLGAYNLNPQDFRLDVYYNNIETGVDVPYLPYGKINGQQLIRVLNCDRLSANGDLHSDGVFDFVNGYTILPNNGRVIFPVVEPFGQSLRAKFAPEDVSAGNYIFDELYDSTRTAATFIQNKNRYKIKGSYRSSSGSDIALNALNIPQGAVVVTANGVPLAENTDYTVDYTLGRVKIINEGILNSGAQVKVSLESNSLFNVQQKSLMGTRLDYKAGRNLTLGSTILRFNERPITQKVSFGDEPVSNTIVGLDVQYKTEAPFITRLLDKLPFYSTKEMSTITTRAEVAKLFPGNAKAIGKTGNSYIDDFEGSLSLIDVRSPTTWFLSSIPQGRGGEARYNDSIAAGYNRARLNWYTIDNMFTRSQNNTTPAYYNNQIFSNNMWRQVFETELFPGKTPPNGQQVVLPVFDLAFYPSIRGPYNYDVKGSTYSRGIDVNGNLNEPQTRWGGIMRRLETNDFQLANVEYIQFWMMDPYNEDYNNETDSLFDKTKPPRGEMYIHLGNISEDIVKDGRMVYENGLRGSSSFASELPVDTSNLAIYPIVPPTINAFSADNSDRSAQDVGYDGLSDAGEREKFARALADMNGGNFSDAAKASFNNDPSSDNYKFFRDDKYDAAQFKTLKRYAYYNNPEGNSPTQDQSNAQNSDKYSTAATTLPNIEDINRDNTLSEIENYYEYHVSISPETVNSNEVGRNFIVDAFNGAPAEFSGQPAKVVKWYQFKIPISQFENVVGGIEGFNSIRFMRVYMTGFSRPVVLRLARFELVRSDWRRYQFDLKKPGEYLAVDANTTSFDVSAVSLQENSTKVPVNYVMPPDIQQQQNVQTTNLVLQNEQALQMRVCDLKDGDSRAVFKNVDLDTRMFNNIKMNVHAEQSNAASPLNDGDLHLFFRVGTDYNNNYYEYEIPLKLTKKGVYSSNSTDDRYAVWPVENEVNFKFSDILATKDARNNAVGYFSNLDQTSTPYSQSYDGYTITIVGNPNLGTVKSIMVGVRNPKDPGNLSRCAEVWINELRLTDFNNQGGWATTAQVQAKLADLGQVSLAGTYSTPFWGSVESKIGQRSKEKNFNWDASTSINAGKFFPDNWKVTLPVFYNYGETRITPLFNPLDPDVKIDDMKKNPLISNDLQKKIMNFVQDYTQRKGFNLTNVHIDGFKRKGAKPMPWDVSNFSATYAYTQIYKHSVNIDSSIQKQYRLALLYGYTIQNPFTIKPFNKMKMFDNKWFALIKDFNLQLMPNSFGASIEGNRTYSSLRNRDITSFYAANSGQPATDFVNPTLYNKNFLINRQYNLRWDLSKALKFDYAANNESRVLEPYGDVSKRSPERRDTVIQNLKKGGTNTTYRQQMNLSATVPLSKIPAFDFITATYRFSGTYTWQRQPFAVPDSMPVGNTIQNTNSHNVTLNMNMTQLYNKVPYFKRVNSPPRPQPAPAKGAAAKGKNGKDTTDKKNNTKTIFEFLARGIMMVKNVAVTFQQSGGQAMPNFMPTSKFGGMDQTKLNAPGFLFTTGLTDDNIRQRSADNDWLIKVRNQTTPYTKNTTRNYTYRSSIEPHGSLKIDLTGNYNKTISRTEYMLYQGIDTGWTFHNSPSETGNFDISTFTLFKAFKDGKDQTKSNLFEEFLQQRSKVSSELAAKNDSSSKEPLSGGGYDGYSNNQQDVLLGAFYRTYTGRNIKDYSTKRIFPTIPLPNWTVSWDGLGKLKYFKKRFRSITVRHGYKSSYRIGGFSNNLLFNPNGETQNLRIPVNVSTNTVNPERSNFASYYNINSVTISESFSPLIKFDLQFVKTGWSANLETKRDKTTTLNITAFQIVETKGQEYVIGLGYMYPKLKFRNIQIQGKVLESNLLIKLDLSYRKNLSVIRDVTTGLSTPTGGTNIITLRSSADYQLTPNINLRLFYDWIRTKPLTSASFPTASANGGFSLRINFQ